MIKTLFYNAHRANVSHTMPHDPLKTCHVLEGFARVLSHKLRTPLSVIQNDLTYIQTLVAEGECRRSLYKCRQIVDLLREISPPRIIECPKSEFELHDMISGLGTAFSFVRLSGTGSGKNCAPVLREAFEKLLTIVKKILPGNAVCEIRIERNKVALAFPVNAACEIAESTASSVTGFFCLAAGLDFIEAPLCDALFAAEGWETTVKANGASIDIICDGGERE